MMDHTYWLKQTPNKPLYPDIEWSKPERRDQAGRLAIVGGNKLGFSAVASSYQNALQSGVGEVRVLVPDCLKKAIPPAMTDVLFGGCTPSGGLNQDALSELTALSSWSSGMLLIGDAGRNSETAITYEQFLKQYEGQLTVTRDAIDLLKNDANSLVERPSTIIVASFAQLQKLFQGVYYPKMLIFSMQLLQLVEVLHKFTVTYPCTIVTIHNETMIIAYNGTIVTQPWQNAMAMWTGSVATEAACYWLWSPKSPLEAVATSVASLKSTITTKL